MFNGWWLDGYTVRVLIWIFFFLIFFNVPVDSRFPYDFYVHMCFHAHFCKLLVNSEMRKIFDKKPIRSQAKH